MPYTLDKPPERIKGLPKPAQEVWIKAYNAAIKQYEGDEEKANATAWSAVKKSGFKKNKVGKWVKMSEVTPFGEVIFGDIDFDAPIEIFRAGKYPQGTITEDDLNTIVANFNPEYHDPPLVKDHQEWGPAFGWAKELWKEGRSLWTKLRDIPGVVKDEIRQGDWRKISSAFYPDFEDKGMALRHVSLLGACPPQVKGMRTWKDTHGRFIPFMEFEITEEDKEAQKARSEKYGISVVEGGNVIKPQAYSNVPDDQWADPVNYRYPCLNVQQIEASVEFWKMSDNNKMYSVKDRERIAKRLKEFKDSEEDMELTEAKIQELLKKNTEDLTKTFSDQLKTHKEDSTKQINELKEENKKLKEQQTTRFSDADRAAKERRIDDMLNPLLKAGTITPAHIDAGLKKFLMAQPEDATIEFGEGEDKKKVPVLEFAIDLFGNKIKGAQVHFGEVGKHAAADAERAGFGTQFKVVASGESITQKSLDVHEKTLAFMDEYNKTHPKESITYRDALLQVGV